MVRPAMLSYYYMSVVESTAKLTMLFPLSLKCWHLLILICCRFRLGYFSYLQVSWCNRLQSADAIIRPNPLLFKAELWKISVIDNDIIRNIYIRGRRNMWTLPYFRWKITKHKLQCSSAQFNFLSKLKHSHAALQIIKFGVEHVH